MIRSYRDVDYEKIKELYQHTEWYGGVFDEARDGRGVLNRKIASDPEAVFVYEENGELLGTISLIEDGRVAWLYRFVVKDFNSEVTRELYKAAIKALRARGHTQVLVYSAINDQQLDNRYQSLGMTKGSDYTCFWQEI